MFGAPWPHYNCFPEVDRLDCWSSWEAAAHPPVCKPTLRVAESNEEIVTDGTTEDLMQAKFFASFSLGFRVYPVRG